VANTRGFSSKDTVFIRGHQINIKQFFGVISDRARLSKAGAGYSNAFITQDVHLLEN